MSNAIHAKTIFQYLIGRRDAIVALMESPGALWLGLIFVISAGFAREYDAESLLHEPWYLLIPVGASLVTSFLLYALLYGAALSKSNSIRPATIPSSPESDTIAALANRPPLRGFWELYPTFLTLCWMTAPLAWLYAIPVERFLSPYDAAVTNYWLLAIVSVWRVLLISRAASVMFFSPMAPIFCLVLLFSDTIVIAASFIIPRPVFDIMGGVRLNAMEQLNAGVAEMSCCFSILLWPILFTIATGYFSAIRGNWSMPAKPEQFRSIHRSAWTLAAASIAVWATILPFTQPEQVLRFRVEHELIRGDVRRGLAMMSKHQRDDFPPNWLPPPYWGKQIYEPDLGDVLTAVSTEPVADWVKELYWSVADVRLSGASIRRHLGDFDKAELHTQSVYLDLHPDRNRVIRETAPDMRAFIDWATTTTDADANAIAKEFKRLLQSVPGEDLLTEPLPESVD